MLDLKNISKTFNPGTINEKKALSGLNLHLDPGDFVTVIGGNGAGKSTMLNAIAGVWPVDEGRIVLDGNDVTALPEHKRAWLIGRVFQDPMMGTAPNMQMVENLALAKRRGQKRGLRWGVTKTETEEYREKLASLGLGLESRLTAKVGLLSGGQRQALTLLITHNMSDAIRHGNRLIMMDNGKIIFDVRGEEKQHLTRSELIEKFAALSGAEMESDEVLLS